MPITEPTVAAALKKITAAAHLSTEKSLIPALTRMQTNADYYKVLKTFYGFFAPLQQLTSTHLSSNDLADIHERRTADKILSDIKSIGYATDDLVICEEMPDIKNKAQAFGALYVAEGSTLGGVIICNMLLKNNQLSLTENNLRFFNAYGKDNPAKWETFISTLNLQPDLDPIAQTANETFNLFKNWIEQSLN